jgi:hypothetical protein
LCKFTNSLIKKLGFGSSEFLWSYAAEGLVGSEAVVVDDVFEEFIGEVIEIFEGCAFDEIVVEGAPEALDLAVGLRPIGPGVAVLDTEFEQHGLEGVLLREANSAPLSVRISAKTSPKVTLSVLIIFSVLNMTGSAFFEVVTSAQARREQLSIRLTR